MTRTRRLVAGLAIGLGGVAAASGLALGQESPTTTTPPTSEAPAPDDTGPGDEARPEKECDKERRGGGDATTSLRARGARGAGLSIQS